MPKSTKTASRHAQDTPLLKHARWGMTPFGGRNKTAAQTELGDKDRRPAHAPAAMFPVPSPGPADSSSCSVLLPLFSRCCLSSLQRGPAILQSGLATLWPAPQPVPQSSPAANSAHALPMLSPCSASAWHPANCPQIFLPVLDPSSLPNTNTHSSAVMTTSSHLRLRDQDPCCFSRTDLTITNK